MLPTLQYGRDRGWKQIVFGHVGRRPDETLAKVAARLSELLHCDVPLVGDWLDESSVTVGDAVRKQIETAEPGAVIVLENTRRYSIETALWKAQASDLERLAPPLARLANEMADKVAQVYVNEAFSAGSLDVSSAVVPAAMDRVALGSYVREQFAGPMTECLGAQLVVFSGLKIDKLDDLAAIMRRGSVRLVISAGSLAMALKAAAARIEGSSFSLGLAGDAENKGKPFYIPPQRIEQAQGIIQEGRKNGVEFALPVDFVLQDGRVAETIGPGDQQFDVGPQTSRLFEQKVDEFIRRFAESADGPAVAFHNGVFGMFEDPRFEEGTHRFIAQLKRLTDAGVSVYVGGGEGGAALEKYGQPDWVTHCFTAGGTVLAALGEQPIPYLVALRMAAS